MKFKFPKDFLWGAATSSHQVEGGLTNNWSEWELKRASEDFKYTSEVYLSNSKYSCESFKYYKEDIKVLEELGLNAYRFSIEWSRIEPKKGEFSVKGIQYYRDLIKELKKEKIEPVVTLWHWTIPVWLEREGGVCSKDFVYYFLRFSEFVLKNISEEVKYWITVNEPEVFSLLSLLQGKWPPNKRNVFRFLQFYFFTFPSMHKGAYMLIKKYNKKAQVSFAKNSAFFLPKSSNFLNVLIKNITRWFSNFLLLDLVKDHLDYIGLNYYFFHTVGFKGLTSEEENVKKYGEWFKVESIQEVIKEAYSRYSLPILITENGTADRGDEKREKWIRVTLESLGRCLKSDIKVIGYLHWSLLDNFEWSDGFKPKFGLVSVNPKSKKRDIKKSGYYYKKYIKDAKG